MGHYNKIRCICRFIPLFLIVLGSFALLGILITDRDMTVAANLHREHDSSLVRVVSSTLDIARYQPIDLDRDGLVDVAYGRGSELWITKNIGDIADSWTISRGLGVTVGEITGVASEDLDRDGRFDLLTVAGAQIQLWGNPGSPFDGNWMIGPSLTAPVGVSQTVMHVVDLDQDGDLDVVSGGVDGVLRLWQNPVAPQGNFTQSWHISRTLSAVGGAILDLRIGDLDRDGKADLIFVSDDVSPTVRLWRNPGGAFSDDWGEYLDFAVPDAPISSTGQHLVVEDLDGDAWVDVAVANSNGAVRVWYNPEETPFSGDWDNECISQNVDGHLKDLVSADLNNDANLELVGVVDDDLSTIVSWKHGEISGTVWIPDWIMTQIGIHDQSLLRVLPADLDHDGDTDLLTGGVGGLNTWLNPLPTWPVGFDTTGYNVGFHDTWIPELVVVDVDKDGSQDIVSAELDGRIVIRRNDGTPFDGEWSASQVAEPTSSRQLLALAAGDLDRDGDIDLTSGYYDYGPVIWNNNGAPFSGTWVHQDVGAQRIGALAVADMNGDGRLDIISGGGRSWDTDPSEQNLVTVWYAPAAPFSDTWQATEVALAYYPVQGLAVGDLDNDGDHDIVIGTSHAPPVGDPENPVPREDWPDVYQIRAFRNDGGDQWTAFDVGRDPEIETLSIIYHGFWGATVTHVALADLDSDGDLDIAATERHEGDFMVMGWQNDGDPFSGELWEPSAIAKGEQHNWLHTHVFWVQAGDFNRDGDLDLVTGSAPPEPFQVMVWENSGLAFGSVISETAWVRHNVGALEKETKTGGLADFDRDGDLDLVAGTFVSPSSEIRLWENYVAPALTLSITPCHQVAVAGQRLSYTVTVTGLYGFDESADLWVSGLPAGITATWSSNPLFPPANSLLTLALSSDSLRKDYSLLAVASRGETVGMTPFTLTITEPVRRVHLPLVLRTQ